MRPQLSDYQLLSSGKVRTLYYVDEEHILLVASDTISAFDFILQPAIPDKGCILTALTVFFLDYLGHKGIQHHLAGDILDERIPEEVLGRALIVKQLKMVPVECVVRGYLTGSGLVEYQATGTVCGIQLPAGLAEASRLPEPIFTPAIKAELGEHDENIDFATLERLHGRDLSQQLREKSLEIYARGAQLAAERNIILADTKFEFGWDTEHNLLLADEVLTPDSSRYWAAESYRPGQIQPSFDKQIVRNWLLYESGWDKNSTDIPPVLPDDIVNKTREKYIEAYETISGLSFVEWPKPTKLDRP